MASIDKRILRAIAAYSGFNASRTLATDVDSEFSITRFGDALATTDPAFPKHPLYNRVLGLGAGDVEHLDAIFAHYKALRCRPLFDLGNDAIVPELISGLVDRGYEPRDALTYHSTSPGSQPAKANASVTIERWGNGRADEFRELLATSGVTCDNAIWEKRRPLYGTDQFRIFVASIDSQPAAWATAYIDAQEKVAYFANAYTAPDHRECGCQRALLDTRLADAHRLRMKTALTDVVPDSVSERNVKRAGFKPAYTATLWTR
jgi:hypothetical protein